MGEPEQTAPDGNGPVDPDDAAEELYGLPRDDFVARRDELARATRAAGDRDAAAAIARLRKPSLAAWLANLLARDHPEEIGALEELGTSMRAAQDRLEGDALRTLSRQRHELVVSLVGRGRRLARDEGVRVGEPVLRELEQTVSAALADPGAARAFADGRLTTALEPGVGFDPSVVQRPERAARPTRPAPARRERRHDERRDDERRDEERREEERQRRARELRRTLEDARAATARAEENADRARTSADEAGRAHDEAAGTVRDLSARLARAREDEDRVGQRADTARADRDAREREAAAARAAFDEAARALDEYEDG